MSDLIVGLYEDWLWLDERIESDHWRDRRKSAEAEEANCQRLMSVPGIGPMISTAMVAAIGVGRCVSIADATFGAWLGSRATPVQHRRQAHPWDASPRRGSRKYLRTLVHPGGARHL